MKQMKKLLAFVLAFAMIITIYQPSAAYAATKKIRLNAKTMTLQVGQKKTLKVKNAGKKAKLKWSSNKKSIATVSKKGVVKAVKVGNAVVTCKVTTKNGKTTKLTCKVAVKKTAKVTSLTVGSQSELEKALKNKNVRKITVATQGAVTFTVPQGNYSKVDLVINAPNADVVNNGKFKSIDIQAIKPNTYRENAKGNSIKITAVDARIIVEAGASLAKVSVTQEGGKIKIEASGTIDAVEISAPVIVDLAVDGKIGEVNVKAAAVLSVEGKTTTAVPIKVSEKAAGASVVSSTPVDVKAAAGQSGCTAQTVGAAGALKKGFVTGHGTRQGEFGKEGVVPLAQAEHQRQFSDGRHAQRAGVGSAVQHGGTVLDGRKLHRIGRGCLGVEHPAKCIHEIFSGDGVVRGGTFRAGVGQAAL